MAVDLKRLLDEEGAPPAKTEWSEIEAAEAVSKLFGRLSARFPLDFVFTPDDWHGLEPMIAAIGRAREDRDQAGLIGGIDAFEQEAERILQRRLDLFAAFDSIVW
jgi:hypothetical protein